MAGKLIKLCVAEVSFRFGQVCLVEQKLNMELNLEAGRSWSNACMHGTEILVLKKV